MLVLSMTLSVTFTTLLVVVAILMRVRNISKAIDNIKNHISLLNAEIELQKAQNRYIRSLGSEINRLKPFEHIVLKNRNKRIREEINNDKPH